MSMVGVGRMVMDDLIFHELWLAKNKFKNFENDTSEDSSEDEDSNDMKELFKKEKTKITKSIASTSTSTTEWFAVILGVFFVAALAGVASYQAYRADFTKELSNSRVSFGMVAEKDAFMNYKTPNKTYDDALLPGNVQPSAYVLYLDVDMTGRLSKGLVKIDMFCKISTNRIILHSTLVTIHKVEVHTILNKRQMDVSGIEYNLKREMMIVKTRENMTANSNYTLFISFEKKLGFKANEGFYLSKFIDGGGRKHMMASTSFEPRGARKAFPCFDEPNYKATYLIIIQHDDRMYKANSNMPLRQTIDIGSNRVESHFDRTPPMSTYLVGWQISDLVYRKVMIREQLSLRVYAPKGRLDETGEAEYIAPRCLRYFEEKFRVNYTLPKLDLIPVTSFTAGADEVWGMIVFVEDSLLVSATTGLIPEYEGVARTVCHEIAHQWFGDLVTLVDWSDLWLKESFAALLESLPLAKYHPSWNIPEIVYKNTYTTALKYDSSLYTHPIQSNSSASYDDITYNKGAAVLGMLKSFLGDKHFFTGIHNYLEQYKFGNANVTQFWEAMTEDVASFDVVSMMENWINTPGYPVILFTEVDSKLHIQQDRFSFQGGKVTVDKETTIWQVPITIKYSNNGTLSNILLTEKSLILDINTTGIDWYKANYGASGYYRVYYPRENWRALLKILNTDHTKLPIIDRASLLSDVFNFANYKYMTLDAALEFTTYLKNETSFVPWSIGVTEILSLRGLFFSTPMKTCFDVYLDELISPTLNKLNSKAKHTHDEKKLISLFVNMAVEIDKKPLINELRQLFLQWIIREGQVKISPTARVSVFLAGIKLGQKDEWNFLLGRLKNETLSNQYLYLMALASSNDLANLQRLVKYAFSNSSGSSELKARTLQFLCLNPVGRNATWKAVKNNYNLLVSQLADGDNLIWFVLRTCLEGGQTENDLKEAKVFTKDQHLENAPQMKRIIETIQRRIDLSREYKAVEHWFRAHNVNCMN